MYSKLFVSQAMNKQSRTILWILIIIIVYEVYLVVYYKYQDYRVNTYMESLQIENENTKLRVERKKEYYTSVQTNAYTDRIMKSAQNRKNPWEDVIFLVDEKDVSLYKKLDSDEIIANNFSNPPPTYRMSNPQKWNYYFLEPLR